MADSLPLHLDVEDLDQACDGFDFDPVVFCRVAGCRWSRSSTWEDLDVGAVDWPKEHPEHA